MRVLHAMPEYWLERTQAWLYVQITALPGSIENHVVCNRIVHRDEFPFPRVHCRDDTMRPLQWWHRGAAAIFGRRRCGWNQRVVRRLGPDVVHSHFGPTGWELLDAVQACGARHVVTFYGLDVNFLPRQGWAARYRELFARIDLALCEGPFMRQRLIELGCAPEKVRVQRLGVDLARLPFAPRAWHPGESLEVLLAASFREKKGLPYAIDALARLAARVPVHVTVIGGSSETPESRAEQARIDAVIARSGLGERIRLRGFQPHDELLREMRQHHVFLSPSVTAANGDTEGGAPYTLVETAASGMPIVSTRHCDIPDVVEDGVTGFLADERDVDGLVACLERLVSDPQHWPAMLAAGRRRVERFHDARRQARELAGHYARLLVC